MKRTMAALGLGIAAWTAAAPAHGGGTCGFTAQGSTWRLAGDCVTTSTISIPDGYTLDGNGFLITARDPADGTFVGAVVRNAGPRASVKNLRLSAENLRPACHAGADRLRGILLDGASGSVSGVVISGVNQGQSGCQEGQGIEVRNTAPGAPTRVTVEGNWIHGYQKTGILVHGNVDVRIVRNEVSAGGQVGHIARNGIQIGFGATGRVTDNAVSGNAYTGWDYVGAGILVVGGAWYGAPLSVGVDIKHNVLRGNDVGVMLSQFGADGAGPGSATRAQVVNNDIHHDAVTNGAVYQAGISGGGNGDLIVGNRVSGAGYDPDTLPGATFEVDASEPYAWRAKVHANR
jgi:hypothetical protein